MKIIVVMKWDLRCESLLGRMI